MTRSSFLSSYQMPLFLCVITHKHNLFFTLCALLLLVVWASKFNLITKLLFSQAEISSKATASVRSPIKNLADVNKSVNIQQLLTAIGYEFLRTPAENLIDGGRDQVMQQRGFQLINPTEKWFPGLNEIRENFASWDWRFGKTPKFSVQKNIELKSSEGSHNMKLNVEVEKVNKFC